MANDELKHLDTGHYYLAKGTCCRGIDNTPLIVLNALPLLNDLEYVEKDELGAFYNGWKYHKYLFYERLPTLFFGIILGIIIFKWSMDLWGLWGGLLGLFLFAFSPNLIAHFSLVSPDALCTALIVTSLYFFYRLLKTIKEKKSDKSISKKWIIFLIVINGIVFGLAQIAKYTSMGLFPILFLIVLVCMFYKRDFGIKKLVLLILCIVLFVILAYVIVWLSYGVHLKNDYFELLSGKKIYAFGFGDYLKGIREARMNYTTGFPSFFMGEVKERGGWLFYFPITFLIKTPIPTLILLFFSVGLLIIGGKSVNGNVRKDFLTEFIIFCPIVFYFIMAILGNLNIGVRHILQIYPLIFISIGRLGLWIQKKAIVPKILVVVLLLWYGISSIITSPNSLGYFNESVGGMKGGYNYLVDSNMDWGQDLKLLKRWMDKKGIERIQLSYFGFGLPEYYGIRYEYLPSGLSNLEIPRDYKIPPKGSQRGLIAISATNLQGVYFKIKGLETDYYYWLKKYKPIDRVGSSILIYEIK